MTEAALPDLTDRSTYTLWTPQQLRFADVDAQLHVNNVAFCTFLESGRVHVFVQLLAGAAPEGAMWVLKQMEIDYREELNWPGDIDVGTVVLRLGKSSVTIGQGIFSGTRCAATSTSVCVLIDKSTRRSMPMPEATRALFAPYA
jgi:acyl-CoA thioester hydrolase